MGGAPVDVLPHAGEGNVAGVAGEGGAPAMGGAAALAGAGGEATGAAAGAGGAGGAPCLNPEQQVVAITADTWIEAAKPGTAHGSDTLLSVDGGAAERRALLQLTLPAATGKVLSRARLVLQLQANADGALASRQLGLHELVQAVSESRTTWTNYGNGGSRKWTVAGGDFGDEISAATLPAGTASGALTFEVTVPIRKIIVATPIPLSVIVIESGPVPAAPAELAFTSREGDALGVPTLLLDYCDP